MILSVNILRETPSDTISIGILRDFLLTQKKIKELGDYQNWRFVGYVLELNFTTATIITSDPYKITVGGTLEIRF